MRFSTIIAASALLLSGANAQEYYCWGHWDWGHRPGCGDWQGHRWVSDLINKEPLKSLKPRLQYPYWFNQWVGTRE
ncbi:hypothetical protein BDW72DRAFT_186797 [Aspergillus terricola var. indicus]